MQTSTDPDVLRKVTHLFPIFLGLRLVPLGLWFIAAPLGLFGPMTEWNQGVPVTVAVVATWAIHRWYASHYGTVEPVKLRFGRNWALLIGVLAGYAALALTPRALDLEPLVLIVALVLLATAIAFMLPRALAGGHRAVAVFLVVAVAGAVLVLATSRSADGLGSLGTALSAVTGVLLVLAGGIEHWLLVRAMSPSAEA